MTYLHGTYTGVRRRLKGQTALLQAVQGGYLAQFDAHKHKEAYGWWFFSKDDFDVQP